nr:MFS transporter [Flavilitoribacter sp.]
TTSGAMTFVSALIFAVGITFFWPTMLSFVAENIPESGALGLSVMGGLGMLSTAIVLPIIGKMMDEHTTGSQVLQTMAILPGILILLFTGLNFYMRRKRAAAA